MEQNVKKTRKQNNYKCKEWGMGMHCNLKTHKRKTIKRQNKQKRNQNTDIAFVVRTHNKNKPCNRKQYKTQRKTKLRKFILRINMTKYYSIMMSYAHTKRNAFD